MQQLTLAAPPKKPLTPAAWLLSSIAWTLACVAGWCLLNALLGKLFTISNVWADRMLLGTAAAAHLLIWYKAMLTTWYTVAEHTEPFWLSLVSAGWTLLLLLFQLASLALLFLVFVMGANGGILR